MQTLGYPQALFHSCALAPPWRRTSTCTPRGVSRATKPIHHRSKAKRAGQSWAEPCGLEIEADPFC